MFYVLMSENKMLVKVTLFVCLCVYVSNAAVFLWSKNNLEISALNDFNDDNLEDLVKKLGYPEVAVYKSSAALLAEFEGLSKGYHTAYNPNGDVSTENATEIFGADDISLIETKQRSDFSRGANILSVLVVAGERKKREVEEASTTESPFPKAPILYRGKSPKNVYSLLYSSRPLFLKTPDLSVELGDSTHVSIDSKNSSFRLDARVPVGDEQFVLQFFFTWQNTYWSLTTVKVKRTMSNFSTNLIPTEPFSVPAHFSYHCSGLTVFSDVDKVNELVIFDMQVQPDSKNGNFGDVYDCVDFTTAPIWSGLLVSGLLGAGLILALIAISEIKTMDKFDNHKTKQLAITVAE